jgi:hypothetical protein
MMQDILLSQEDDQHSWRLEGSGLFTSKSAYRAFFNGSTTCEPWWRIWKTWAPGKCKVFLWLAIRNRCWTADHVQKRELPHPDNYATRKWRVCNRFSLHVCLHAISGSRSSCVPRRRDHTFATWWNKASKRVGKAKTLLWKQHNYSNESSQM